jgi:hypothetical protein
LIYITYRFTETGVQLGEVLVISWKVNGAGIFVLKVVDGNLQVIPYHSCSSKVMSDGIEVD